MYWPLSAPNVYSLTRHATASSFTSADPGTIAGPNSTGPTERSSHDGLDTTSDALLSDGDSAAPSPGIRDPEKGIEKEQGNGSLKSPSLATDGMSEKQQSTQDPDTSSSHILSLKVSRSGTTFVTISTATIVLWQTRPTVVLARVTRSASSLEQYGGTTALMLRPDGQVIVVQTSLGYLITYSVANNPHNDVYRLQPRDGQGLSKQRQHSLNGEGILSTARQREAPTPTTPEVHLRFRMVIKVDAGICKALALEEEIIVATDKPPAIQCIRWKADEAGRQTMTELQSKLSWLPRGATVTDMIHDKPMNLSTWITSDGKAYAVQRATMAATANSASARTSPNPDAQQNQRQAFKGYCFHDPETEGLQATCLSINARFSLLAVGCADGSVSVYMARDYDGNVPLSHRLLPPASLTTTGPLQCLTCSPDGYSLFAGFRAGWAMWSVFGKLLATSFVADRSISTESDDTWLLGIQDAHFVGAGSGLLLLSPESSNIWMLNMARSAVSGCFSAANVSRPILQTADECMLYLGYDVPDLSAISPEVSLWQNVQMPSVYLIEQGPIRSVVSSADGRYVAIAGKRGLAHYSVASNRWKTFDDPYDESQFSVRGGMCWYQHFLIAAVDTSTGPQLRIFSREHPLDDRHIAFIEELSAPVAVVAISGDDSVLAYTYDNVLRHYIFSVAENNVRLIPVGEIAFHGIIRSPTRVRSISWILPDAQLRDGDPSRDVATATVLFLVDGQLVLLQPSTNDQGDLKYDMRVIAQKVEFYILGRDIQSSHYAPVGRAAQASNPDAYANGFHGSGLNDSLWYFDGTSFRVWTDVQDCLTTASLEYGRELPSPLAVRLDFYPMCPVIDKGFVCGAESDLTQRRDIRLSSFRVAARTHLFLPAVLRHHLSQFDSPAALHLSHRYQNLPYWSHALEMLLHDVLDDEVESPPPNSETALLPGVLSFLSSFPTYLDIVVQCTRKTEVRSWRTLFAHLPPSRDLFVESLEKGDLKTAGGYLLVMHNLEESETGADHVVRLLRKARDAGDADLCKELARFLMALDPTGDMLRDAMRQIDKPPTSPLL